MPVKFLDAMAQAIYFYEGHKPQDPNHRNNNPGNLRPWEGCEWPVSAEGFVVFPSFQVGYAALLEDLRAKVTGHNEHGLNKDSELRDFFAVYAPSSDRNEPMIYAQFVALWLSVTYGNVFFISSSFREIFRVIGQTVD